MQTFLANLFRFSKRTFQGIRLLPNLRLSQAPLILDNLTKKDFTALSAFVLLFVAAGGFLIFQAGASDLDGAPDFGGEHIEGLVGQPRFINPVLSAASSVDTDLSRLVYAQLLKFDEDLNLVPDMAEALPAISDDQKNYTLKLKPNLKWHDGRQIMADDVVFTIQIIQNSDYESPLRANWGRVKVEKIDDLTVNFQLREVSASFVTNFTLAIIPKHIWENLSPSNFRLNDHNLQPIGSGPFVFREIKKTSDGVIRSMTFKANDAYHDGRPYLNTIAFKFYENYDNLINAFQGREISGLGYVPIDRRALVESSNKYNQHQINLPQYHAVFFNLIKNPVLADKAVRQALWLTTDRTSIINDVFMGYAKPAYGPILEGNLGYSQEIADRTHLSLVEASGILDKGGWILDADNNSRTKNNRKLEFNLVTNNSYMNIKTAQMLQTQWAKIGVAVNPVIVSQQELEQDYIRPRNFDALLFAENTGADPDPYPFWHSTQSRDPGLNLSGFANADADRLLTQARQTTDTAVRAQAYEQFQQIITNEIPAVFLNSSVYVYNIPKKLRGVNLTTIIHPSERFLNVRNWYLNTK